jgi:hypothetical protein
MTFEEVAAVPQAAVLGLQGLRYKGQIQKGQLESFISLSRYHKFRKVTNHP